MSVDAQPNAELIRQIEEAAADAVPPAVLEPLDGWRLRFNHGVKRRPNSVLANVAGGALELPEKVARAEAFYARYGVRARFQLSPASSPPQLASFLGARGYRRAPESVEVQTAPLVDTTHPERGRVTFSATLTPVWLELYSRAEGLEGSPKRTLQTMLTRLPGHTAFVTVQDAEGEGAATALGVAHAGWLGLFNVATLPHARRQGLATAGAAALMAWGERQGLHRAYLQVSEGNRAAKAVYARLGFSALYTYGYLEAR